MIPGMMTPSKKMMMGTKAPLAEMAVVTTVLLLLLLVLRETPSPVSFKHHLTPPATKAAAGHPPPSPLLEDGASWLGFLVFAEAAPVVCTANLTDVTPAEGETVNIQAGECPGDITVSSDNVAIIIHPGAGAFQPGKHIVITTNSSQITNFTLDISCVEWDLATFTFFLFPSSGWPSTVTLSDSTISIRDSNFSGYGRLGLGAMTGSRVSIDRTTLAASRLTPYGLVFLQSTTNTTVQVSNSNITATSTATSGSYIASGLSFSLSFTNSSLQVSDSSITATSPAALAHAVTFHYRFITSAIKIQGSKLTGTSAGTTGWGIVYGFYIGYTPIDSTIQVIDCTISAMGVASANAIYFTNPFANTNTTVEVSGSSVTAIASSGTARSLYYAQKEVSSIVLRYSKFTGSHDGPGPMRALFGGIVEGSLLAQCTYWNSDSYMNVSVASYTSVYTSNQFSSTSLLDCTTTPSDSFSSSTSSSSSGSWMTVSSPPLVRCQITQDLLTPSPPVASDVRMVSTSSLSSLRTTVASESGVSQTSGGSTLSFSSSSSTTISTQVSGASVVATAATISSAMVAVLLCLI